MKKLKVKNFADGTKMTTAKILKTNNRKITFDDVHKIKDYMEAQAQAQNKPIKLGIRAMAVDSWKTLKSMDAEDIIDKETYDAYYVNKVVDVSKFQSFEQLQLYVIK